MGRDGELEEASEQSRRSLLKNLIALSWCRITEDDGSGDLLSRSWMHVDERDEVVLTAQRRRRRKRRCVGGSWLFVIFTFMAAARIYREDPLRVRASRNRLSLSLLKRIRHGFVTKINGKRTPHICEALDRILVNYSRAHRAPTPIASLPHLASPSEVSVHMCFSLSSLFHTLVSA
jgi:hypothetical protein